MDPITVHTHSSLTKKCSLWRFWVLGSMNCGLVIWIVRGALCAGTCTFCRLHFHIKDEWLQCILHFKCSSQTLGVLSVQSMDGISLGNSATGGHSVQGLSLEMVSFFLLLWGEGLNPPFPLNIKHTLGQHYHTLGQFSLTGIH